MASMTLYLEESDSQVSGECLTLPSRICLFLLNALQYHRIDESSRTKVICITSDINKQSFVSPTNTVPIIEMNVEDCPEVIRAVKLPLLMSHYGQMVHCGLSSVLRKLVKHSHLCQPSKNFNSLLGHHEMCLRSCAEVSVWTKFCEVEMPLMLEKLCATQESCTNGGVNLQITEEMLKLEEHFQKPAVIPQITKKKKLIYVQLTQKDNFLQRNRSHEMWIDQLNSLSITNYLRNGCRKESEMHEKICNELKNQNKDLPRDLEVPGLSHDFAEGVSVTLTDMVLLPIVSCALAFYDSHHSLQLLAEVTPRVIEWYQRLVSVDALAQSLKEAGIAVIDVTGKVRISTCKTQPLQRESGSLVKRKNRVTTSEAGAVIEKLKELGLEIQNSQDCLSDISIDWKTLPDSVHPQEGCLPPNRISRKCEQLENLCSAVRNVAKPGDVIVDFCAGGGHLGILLAFLLPDCKVLLVENKEESIRRALDRVQKLDLKNITLYQTNLEYFCGRFDVGTCLHACGVATDLVLHKCLQASTSFVICPCCYGAVQNTQHINYPLSQFYRAHLSYQEYLLLAHAADDRVTGKEYMIAVDKDRARLATDLGYTVQLKSLQPLTCSPKNNLLIGQRLAPDTVCADVT